LLNKDWKKTRKGTQLNLVIQKTEGKIILGAVGK
jgi:hypothetical protein